jgi:hypothetical protein
MARQQYRVICVKSQQARPIGLPLQGMPGQAYFVAGKW